MPRGRPPTGRRWRPLRRAILGVFMRRSRISRTELLQILARGTRHKPPAHRAFSIVMKQLREDEIISVERDAKDRRRVWYVRRKGHALPLEEAALVIGLLEFWRLTSHRHLRYRVFMKKRIGAIHLRPEYKKKNGLRHRFKVLPYL